jgi:hypothetical protein
MTDKNFFRMAGTLQFMLSWICFYTALGAATAGALGVAVGALCVLSGVVCAVSGAKLWGMF